MTDKIKQTNTAIEEIDLKEIFFTVLQKWYIFVAFGILCLGFAIYYVYSTPPQYQTTGTILIRSEQGMGMMGSFSANIPMASDFLDMGTAVDDEVVIFKSKTILRKMVESLQLQTATFYKKRLGGYHQLNNNEPFLIIYPDKYKENLRGILTINVTKTKDNEWKIKFKHKWGFAITRFKAKINDLSQPLMTPWGEFKFIENQKAIDPKYPNYSLRYITVPVKSRIDEYSTKINISLSNKKANAIDIKIEGGNISLNEDIVNKLIELYELDKYQDNQQTAFKFESFINERINLLDQELKIIESKVEEFRLNKNIANIEIQSTNAIEASRDYEILITEVDMEYTLMTFIEEHIKNSDILDLIPSNTGITDEALSNLIISYNYEVMEYLRLTRSTNEDNPYISQLKDKILLSRKNILQTITNMKEGAMLRREDIVKRNDEINTIINNVPTLEREYIEVAREQEIKRNLYLFLLQKKEENQLAISASLRGGKIVDQAYTSERPVSPRKLISLFIACFFAVLLGLAYIYVENLLNTNIKDIEQLRKFTKLPIIVSIPSLKNRQFDFTLSDNNDITEAFYTLRTNLIFNSNNNKVIGITSSSKENNKTFVTTNIALSFALLNKKVALVDLDFRNISSNSILSTHSNVDLSDYLSSDDISIEDIKQPFADNQYLDIYATNISKVNSNLLFSNKLNSLFDYLKEHYDYIIINSASTEFKSDCMIINQFTDQTLFVCCEQLIKKEDIKLLETLAKDCNLNNVSIILNKA